MSTIDQLTSNIIDDLAKDGEEGITAAVSTAISQSIAYYESSPWWFLETQDTATTSDGTEYYDAPSSIASTEVTITIQVQNNTYPLIKRTFQTLEDWYVRSTVFTGYPSDYAMWKNQIRLYPIPNGSYTLTYNYYRSLGAPTAGNSNAWTTDAETLIQARAEWILYSRRYHDLEAATVLKAMEREEYVDLLATNDLRLLRGKTRKRRI